MKVNLLSKLLALIALPLVYIVAVPLWYLLGWWSEYVDGVEPKSGQKRYDHKTVDGVECYRRAGLRHRSAKWKPVPTTTPGFCNMDIASLYPHVIL